MTTAEAASRPSPDEIARWGRIAHDYLRERGVNGALVGGLYDREDLVQETLIKLLRVYPRKPRESEPVTTTYVRLTAHSVYLDTLRRIGKRSAQTSRLGPHTEPPAPAETPSLLRPAPARELLKYLAGRQLKAYRAYLDRGSYQAAAVVLQQEYPNENWSEKNVRAYCSHAHSTLRQKAEAGELDRKDYAAWALLLIADRVADASGDASGSADSLASGRTTRILGASDSREDVSDPTEPAQRKERAFIRLVLWVLILVGVLACLLWLGCRDRGQLTVPPAGPRPPKLTEAVAERRVAPPDDAVAEPPPPPGPAPQHAQDKTVPGEPPGEARRDEPSGAPSSVPPSSGDQPSAPVPRRGGAGPVSKVQVPNLSGTTGAETARTILRHYFDLNFAAVVDGKPYSPADYPRLARHKVVSQDPLPGAWVERGTRVTCTLELPQPLELGPPAPRQPRPPSPVGPNWLPFRPLHPGPIPPTPGAPAGPPAPVGPPGAPGRP